MRSGAAYVESLRDGRAVFLDGERIGDVTAHAGFAEPIRRIAQGYDRARSAPEITTCLDPETGHRIGAMWLRPRGAEDLGVRQGVHRFWAEGSYGLMGRTPDHVACVLTAFATAREFFAQGGAGFADNAVRFHGRAQREDLYVSYAIVPPQVDRTKPAHQLPEPFLHPGVVKERDDGIVLRGCQAIATSAVLSDWLFLSYITPLAPGDEDYAVSLVVPIGAEGVRLYPRRPFSAMATSTYDYPLSARFDEVDTTVVFRDVLVPWEQVFIYRNVELVNRQFHDTPSHTLANFQALVRFGVKLQFMAGLALKLAAVQGSTGSAAVQAQLGGDIAALCASFDALVHAAARFPLLLGGWARPHPQYIYAGMSLQRRLIVDMLRTIRELAGGAFQAVPSSEQNFVGLETREDTERYYGSSTASARERIKLLKLIWDFVGTEFAGRQLQYEMFYSASQPVVNTRMYRAYDWDAATAFVDRCLGEY
jgi:4-hydroxyphenylacetate 3-monooxygenase